VTQKASPQDIPSSTKGPSLNARAIRIAAIYAAAGIAWILLSDKAVDWLIAERSATFVAQTFKGVFYVVLTTALVYWLALRAFRGAERDILQSQLEHSQNMFDTVLANLGEAVFIVDLPTRTIQRCNSAVTPMFGYTPSELTGRRTEILHVDRASFEAIGCSSEAALQKNMAYRTRYRMKRKDGVLIETENTVIALDGAAGRQSGVVSIVRDMTRQVQAERALRISEEHYRLLADNTLDMIWTMNMDYEFTYVNPAVVPMLGYAPEAFIGTSLQEHCHRDVYAKLLHIIERGIAQGIRDTGTPIETEVLRKDGSPLPVEILSKILFDSRNRAIGIQGTARDISERLAMEAQLRQSQKLEAIGTLASSVAHEINNPISGISGYAELIAEEAFEGEEIIAYASEIKSATERIRTIVQNLLGFARKEDSPDKTTETINDIVASMLSLVQTIMRHDQIAIQVDIPDGLPRILCRKQQIQQVIMNLLTNARDALNREYPGYDDDKKIVITARTIHRAGQAFVRTIIEDRGAGISDDVRERIFEPFFTTKPAEKGTGLGLWIIYSIVKDHGGEIDVATSPGEFTRFNIDLPAVG
jgi:PAS domain S-box-containing protein